MIKSKICFLVLIPFLFSLHHCSATKRKIRPAKKPRLEVLTNMVMQEINDQLREAKFDDGIIRAAVPVNVAKAIQLLNKIERGEEKFSDIVKDAITKIYGTGIAGITSPRDLQDKSFASYRSDKDKYPEIKEYQEAVQEKLKAAKNTIVGAADIEDAQKQQIQRSIDKLEALTIKPSAMALAKFDFAGQVSEQIASKLAVPTDPTEAAKQAALKALDAKAGEIKGAINGILNETVKNENNNDVAISSLQGYANENAQKDAALKKAYTAIKVNVAGEKTLLNEDGNVNREVSDAIKTLDQARADAAKNAINAIPDPSIENVKKFARLAASWVLFGEAWRLYHEQENRINGLPNLNEIKKQQPYKDYQNVINVANWDNLSKENGLVKTSLKNNANNGLDDITSATDLYNKAVKIWKEGAKVTEETQQQQQEQQQQPGAPIEAQDTTLDANLAQQLLSIQFEYDQQGEPKEKLTVILFRHIFTDLRANSDKDNIDNLGDIKELYKNKKLSFIINQNTEKTVSIIDDINNNVPKGEQLNNIKLTLTTNINNAINTSALADTIKDYLKQKVQEKLNEVLKGKEA